MSFRRWSSILERRRALNLALTAVFMEETMGHDLTESTSSSSSSSSDDDDNIFINNATDTMLQHAARLVTDIDGGTEDSSIQWRAHGGLLIGDVSEDDAIAHFRFRKRHLQELANKIWPRVQEYLTGVKTSITFDSGNYSAPYESLLLMVLFRLSRPRRIRPEMESFFGFRRSKISAGIKAMVNALYFVAKQYLESPEIFRHRMEYYAERIANKCGWLVHTVWGFIDGTLRRTCRPSYFQKLLYSGHKRAHGIKFQSVVTPDGLFACFFGPINGNRHDSYMLARSELIPKLQDFMPAQNEREGIADAGDNSIFSLYGDPAYPQSLYIFGGYRNPPPGSAQSRWNTEMSKIREVVEWGFANLISNWAFLDFKASMMIFQSPVAKYYIVAAFLCNLRTCFYGNQIMDYFDCDPMTIDDYLSLIDRE
jgi:hypothetical protein